MACRFAASTRENQAEQNGHSRLSLAETSIELGPTPYDRQQLEHLILTVHRRKYEVPANVSRGCADDGSGSKCLIPDEDPNPGVN